MLEFQMQFQCFFCFELHVADLACDEVDIDSGRRGRRAGFEWVEKTEDFSVGSQDPIVGFLKHFMDFLNLGGKSELISRICLLNISTHLIFHGAVFIIDLQWLVNGHIWIVYWVQSQSLARRRLVLFRVNLVVEIVQIAGSRLVLLPHESFKDSAEILRLVVASRKNSRSAIGVVVDFLLCLDDGWYVLDLEAVVTKVEVVGGVKVLSTIHSFVRDEIGETSENVSADFAFVNQIALTR